MMEITFSNTKTGVWGLLVAADEVFFLTNSSFGGWFQLGSNSSFLLQ